MQENKNKLNWNEELNKSKKHQAKVENCIKYCKLSSTVIPTLHLSPKEDSIEIMMLKIPRHIIHYTTHTQHFSFTIFIHFSQYHFVSRKKKSVNAADDGRFFRNSGRMLNH